MESKEGDSKTLLPPVYHQLGSQAPPLTGSSNTVPLPTYDQSEKYEKEGVALEIPASIPETEGVSGRSKSGTFCEFVIFFVFCSFFSVLGFLLSFCLATTTAAQSGAIAGLGAAFVMKPMVYEFYNKNNERDWSREWCASSYTDEAMQNSCIHRTTITVQIVLGTLGIFGLILLYRGWSGYFQSRRPVN